MATHTPGPWDIACTGDAVIAGDQKLVADVMAHGRIRSSKTGFIPLQEGLANCRLIAAAPDLLEAAKMAVEIIRESWGNEPGAPADCQAVRILEEAIEKADGGK